MKKGGWSTRKRKETQDTGATWNYEETHHTQEMITDHSWVGVEIRKTKTEDNSGERTER